MTTVTRDTLAKMQNDIRLALSEVAKKYGLEAPIVDLRRNTTGSMVRLMKLDMNVATELSKAMAAESAAAFGSTVDVKLAAVLKEMGITKLTNRKGETITAYKPNRYKYPFVFRGPKGGLWKASESEILARFAA